MHNASYKIDFVGSVQNNSSLIKTIPRWPQPQLPPRRPHRAQGPRAPGAERPALGELSPALRNRIAQSHLDGNGYRAIGCKFLLPVVTVQSTIQKQSQRTSSISKSRSGCPQSLSEAQKDALFEAVWEEPNINMQQLKQIHAPHVSIRTIQWVLAKKNIKKWKQLKRPRLLRQHVAARLAWVSFNS